MLEAFVTCLSSPTGKTLGVLSIRDLLKEIVAHHERLIRDMELAKLTMLSGGTSY